MIKQREAVRYLPESVTGEDILIASAHGAKRKQIDVCRILHWAALMTNEGFEDGIDLASAVFAHLQRKNMVTLGDIRNLWYEARIRAEDNAPLIMIIDTHFDPETKKLTRFSIKEVNSCLRK